MKYLKLALAALVRLEPAVDLKTKLLTKPGENGIKIQTELMYCSSGLDVVG
jgi:hypothetical protein